MADRLVAVTRGFRYALGDGDAVIKRAGGLSVMTAEQKAKLRFKEVAIGGDCSDMPAAAAALYLSRGDIAKVEGLYPARTDFGKEHMAALHGSERVLSADDLKGMV